MTIRLIVLSVAFLLPLLSLVVAEEPQRLTEQQRLEQRLQNMLGSAELLREADQVELASEIAARAEAVANQLRELQGSRPEKHRRATRTKSRSQRSQWHLDVMQTLDEVREQVRELREEVGGLREQLDVHIRLEKEARFGRVDLEGRWLMTLPAGFQYETRINSRGDGLYQVEVRGNLRGLYRHRGNKLVVEIPSDERLTEFVWEFQNENLLLLTEAPPTAKVGSDYRGAILQRTQDNPNNESGIEKETGVNGT